MFKFFEAIANFLGSVVDFILSLFKMLQYLFGYITQGLAYVLAILGHLPDFVEPFVIVISCYIVVVTLLNKGE